MNIEIKHQTNLFRCFQVSFQSHFIARQLIHLCYFYLQNTNTKHKKRKINITFSRNSSNSFFEVSFVDVNVVVVLTLFAFTARNYQTYIWISLFLSLFNNKNYLRLSIQIANWQFLLANQQPNYHQNTIIFSKTKHRFSFQIRWITRNNLEFNNT